jgi:hypothetical protein
MERFWRKKLPGQRLAVGAGIYLAAAVELCRNLL